MTPMNASLTRIGAIAAVLTVAGFVTGIAVMASSGVQVLIPETGAEGREWAADVVDAGDAFVAGAAIVVFAGLFGLVAFVGFWDALRGAGRALVIAPIAGAAGMVLVTVSHATPIAIALELAPSYEDSPATFDAFAQLCLLTNYFGDVLIWAVTTPLYAVAVLKTGVAPRWIGWVGLVAAFFAGWLGLLSPVSSAVEGISTIGFFAFFLFTASLGVALLRRRDTPVEAPAAATPA
jgi:hypothetical protein